MKRKKRKNKQKRKRKNNQKIKKRRKIEMGQALYLTTGVRHAVCIDLIGI
jgi:hypothetical protein